MKSKILQDAFEHITFLCKNPNKWRMSIPVQEDDSDSILCNAINYAESLEKELAIAVKYLMSGKAKFIPNTDNSLVDDFIEKHKYLLEE